MLILGAFPNRPIVQTGVCQPQQRTLPPETDLRMSRVNELPLLLNGQGQLFFQPVHLHFELSNLLV